MQSTVNETSGGGPSAPPVDWRLTIAHHVQASYLGRSIALGGQRAVPLGRQAIAFGAGALDDERASREHAVIDVDGARLVLRDLGSRNGTLVNGRRVERAELAANDVISIGRVLLLVHRGPDPATADSPPPPPPTSSAPGSTPSSTPGSAPGSAPGSTPGSTPVPEPPELVGAGAAHLALCQQIARVAPHTTTVTIIGESGAGKEVVARAIHRQSGRTGRFVALSCGALPDDVIAAELFGHADRSGLLAEADGGTLVLDRVDDASPALQAALLRFLESGEVRPLGAAAPSFVAVRVVATSGEPLDERVRRGMRIDFAARLSRWVLAVPPLRERLEDVPLLAAHFVRRYAGQDAPLHHTLALRFLRNSWPQNVRALEAAVECAVIEADGKSPIPLTPAVERMLAGGRLPDGDPVLAAEPVTPAPRCTMARDGGWFQLPGAARVTLEQRRALPSLLAALLAHRAAQPGRALSVTDLLAAGWPGEKVIEEAGANRVYVALTTLRKLGLRDVIQRNGQGYLIEPEIPLDVVDA